MSDTLDRAGAETAAKKSRPGAVSRYNYTSYAKDRLGDYYDEEKKSRTTLMNRQGRPRPGGRCQRLSLYLLVFLLVLLVLPSALFVFPSRFLALFISLSAFCFSLALSLCVCQLSSATTGSVSPMSANTRGTAITITGVRGSRSRPRRGETVERSFLAEPQPILDSRIPVLSQDRRHE